MYQKYMIYPLQNALSTEAPSLHLPFPYGSWGTKNGRIEQKSWKKRWGYNTADRTLTSHTPHAVILYQLKGGTRNTMYLTATDLIKRETGAGGTWSFKTETYTTGTIASITDTAVVGTATAWGNGTTNIAAGDYFIMDNDHDSDSEPDSNWVKISSVTDDTHLTLASAYTKNGTTYKIRKVYTVPSNERWSWCIVDDKLIFTNGNTNVQYWDGSSGYATDLNSSVAVNARNCIEYADRLVIADYGSTRDPLKIGWSKNGDPTNWTDSTSGSATLLGTENYIIGLGKAGAYLIVYRQNSIVIGSRTSEATAPIIFPGERKGVGAASRWGIVEADGTNFFLSRNDFYRMQGDYPESIGAKIRDKFFDIVAWTEIEKTWAQHYELRNEIEWIANTSEGKLGFVYNYKLNEWSVNQYRHDITAAGTGAI